MKNLHSGLLKTRNVVNEPSPREGPAAAVGAAAGTPLTICTRHKHSQLRTEIAEWVLIQKTRTTHKGGLKIAHICGFVARLLKKKRTTLQQQLQVLSRTQPWQRPRALLSLLAAKKTTAEQREREKFSRRSTRKNPTEGRPEPSSSKDGRRGALAILRALA